MKEYENEGIGATEDFFAGLSSDHQFTVAVEMIHKSYLLQRFCRPFA